MQPLSFFSAIIAALCDTKLFASAIERGVKFQLELILPHAMTISATVKFCDRLRGNQTSLNCGLRRQIRKERLAGLLLSPFLSLSVVDYCLLKALKTDGLNCVEWCVMSCCINIM